MARCLSTSLQSCAFCAVTDCFSLSMKRIKFSADPAACIKDCISAGEVPVICENALFDGVLLCVEAEEMAESIEGFRGNRGELADEDNT